MLSEQFLSSVSGPPLSNNTAIAKDVGIYQHSLSPTPGIKATFKKSSCPPNCLVASDTHIFAAQQDKAYVHVYSLLRRNQEAFVPFSDRIRCLCLVGDVLLVGTAEGKVLLWDICTGLLVSTPAAHIQAVSCMAATRNHLITGSDDSNLKVWCISRLLDLDRTAETDPDRTLSRHRAAITSLVASTSSNPNSSLCVSASRDKTCIVWNYRTGDALRTIWFPTPPLCIAIDPFPRILAVSLEDGSLYSLSFFGGEDESLLRSHPTSSGMKAPPPIAQAAADQGPASCLALSYDGSTLLSGHIKGQIVKWSLNGHCTEIASLNSAVSNIIFLSPLPLPRATRVVNVVKPSGSEYHVPVVQFDQDTSMVGAPRFGVLMGTPGASLDLLWSAVAALDPPRVGAIPKEEVERKEEQELSQVLDQLGSFAKLAT